MGEAGLADGRETLVGSEEASFEKRLLDALESGGTLGTDSAERARRAHARTGGSLVDILIRLGLCEEKALAQAVAEHSGKPLLDLSDLPPKPIRKDELSIAFLRDARILPLEETDEAVSLLVADPVDGFSLRALELVFKKRIDLCVGTASQIEDAVWRLYGSGSNGTSDATATMAGAVTDMDLARLRESASEAPIIRFVERLIARAVDAGASDIHIEPLERQLRVRLRIDGMLIDAEPAPLSLAPAVVSRVKILARLDIAERRLPQDGSIKMNVRGREVDLRIATTPIVHGETVVVRILDRGAVRLDLADLGFDGAVREKLGRILDRPNGILLVTGPTGSGKSTTLYAALDRLNKSWRKIITVEDPVEYKIDGLNQIQVKPDIGLDFAKTLRSILRHDPDVVMVGEIRDAETARIAMQAALTGHLVLSTLHTNDAASSVTRLLDMGIENYLVTATLAGVMAQRLVRLLCANCKRPTPMPAGLGSFFEKHATNGHPPKLFGPVGCDVCRGTGYRGRSVIAEIMLLDENVRQGVLDRCEAGQLRARAIEGGMETLFENGIRTACAGLTSYDEVARVAQDLGG